MYVQDERNVLFLSVGPIQRNLHRLLREAQLGLAEEMHLHLVVENCGGGADSVHEGLQRGHPPTYHDLKLVYR